MRWGRKKEEKLGDKGAPFHVLLARVFGSAAHFMTAVTPQDQENEFHEGA